MLADATGRVAHVVFALIPNQPRNGLVHERCNMSVVERAALEVLKGGGATESLVTRRLLLLSDPLFYECAPHKGAHESYRDSRKCWVVSEGFAEVPALRRELR
jgi:hypothetical protein